MKGKRMRGMVTATVTPVNKLGNFEPEMIKPMVDILIDKGSDAIFAIGSTGNFTLFSSEERKKAAETYVNAVNGRVPLCIHIGADTESQALDLARHAGAVGADCLSCVPPYYFKYDADALTGFFKRIAAVNPELPLYIYNIPMFTANDITPPMLKRMKNEIPNLAGVKDTTQDFTRFLDYIDALGSNFDNFMGSDAMCIASLDAGGAGGICATATHNPELMVEIFTLWRKGQRERAQRLQFLAARMRLMFMKLPFFSPRVAIMRMRGIIDTYPKNPMRAMTADEEKLLINTMKNLEQEFEFDLLSKA